MSLDCASRIVVLYDPSTPALVPDCARDRCALVPLGGPLPRRSRTDTVIVSGHSAVPEYLSLPPAALAEAIDALAPRLVVIDTCEGFSTPLLRAIARKNARPTLVGSTVRIPDRGLVYGRAFFDTSRPLAERVAAISHPRGTALQSRIPAERELDALEAQLDGLDPAALTRRLRRVWPSLAPVRSVESDATTEVLVYLSPERFRR